ncbi:hypothetical protein ACMD2_05608 [Ananas comosus]|uniref:Ultraviolet-B-repressible protein n=1 Tax=Ananas comosus TaxID=4615 RepID=A0A199VWH5_ANACO|nr:hypothetical protein ACMD2_05608 [Ananas comosus]
MASASALFIAAPPPTKRLSGAGAGVLLRPARPIPAAGRRGGGRVAARASAAGKEGREWAAGMVAAAAAAALVIPEVAEAAQPGISPSLKNFLLSIVAGGVVLGVLVGAVIAVANFDPVKRT